MEGTEPRSVWLLEASHGCRMLCMSSSQNGRWNLLFDFVRWRCLRRRRNLTRGFILVIIYNNIIMIYVNIIAPARNAGASYSRPGFLIELVWIVPQWRGVLRRRRKIHEYNTRYFKFHEIYRKRTAERVHQLSEDLPNHIAPGPMLTGIELFQHRFSGNPENQCFFWNQEDWTVSRFPVFGPFLVIFFSKSFASRCS